MAVMLIRRMVAVLILMVMNVSGTFRVGDSITGGSKFSCEFFLVGVNMGYMENSYSNSNNGGSVNSQDSLWQMKMASAASNANSVSNDHAPRITDQVNHYGKTVEGFGVLRNTY